MRQNIITGRGIPMRIGLNKRKITPAIPVLMAGYEGVRKAEGVLDDLYVKVCIFEKKDQFCGVIQYDLIAVDNLIIEAVKERALEIGLNMDRFVIAATHTHSGPGGVVDTEGILKGMEQVFQEPDRDKIRFIADRTISALKAALENLSEGRIFFSFDQIRGICGNRNDKSLKGSEETFFVYIHKNNGEKAAIINFACHPTILNASNRRISADFPGAIDRFLERKGYGFSMFLNGSSGDISTRYTRKDSSYEEVERMGSIIGQKVLENFESATETDIEEFYGRKFSFSIMTKKPEEISEAKNSMDYYKEKFENAKEEGISGGELREIESRFEGARVSFHYAEHPFVMESFNLLITVFKIDDHFFVVFPGELFSELSMKIADEKVHFINYANGYIGYIANQNAYDKNYYEALSSPFARGEGERVMEKLEDIIKNWRKS